MKGLFLIIITFLGATTVRAQEHTTVIFGSIDKPFNGYMSIAAVKGGILRRYAENRLYDNAGRYAIAVPASAADTLHITFIRNESRSQIFNDTMFHTVYYLKSASKIKLDLGYHAATKKYKASKTTQAPFTKIVPADSLALMICSFDSENLKNSKLLTTRKMMPEETAVVFAHFDKTAGSHVMAMAISKPGLYDAECSKLRYRVFIKPGETLLFNTTGITASSINYEIKNASEENRALIQWFNISRPVSSYGYFIKTIDETLPAPEDFMKEYSALMNRIPETLSTIQTKNPAFNKLLNSLLPFDIDLGALTYLAQLNRAPLATSYAGSYNGLKVLPEVMKTLAKSKTICDKNIVKLFDYHNYVHAYSNLWEAMYPVTNQPVTKEPDLNKWQLSHLCSKEAQSVYLYIELMRFKRVCSNRYDFNVKFAPFKDYLLTKEMQSVYHDVNDKYSKEALLLNATISEALLPDSSGTLVNVGTAFKGKVVLFDLWGTWCGPCRAQIPYWKSLVDEYKGNPDVVFVGIAHQLNTPHWIADWKKVIRESDFPAIHLIDIEGERFHKPLNITSPCYMLLGKDGKWIENRCPKPEQKEKLKEMIDRALVAG